MSGRLSRGNLRWNLRVAGPGVARHAVTLTNKERRALRVLRKHLEALEDWIAEFREVERRALIEVHDDGG